MKWSPEGAIDNILITILSPFQGSFLRYFLPGVRFAHPGLLAIALSALIVSPILHKIRADQRALSLHTIGL